jgi:cytochrome c553
MRKKLPVPARLLLYSLLFIFTLFFLTQPRESRGGEQLRTATALVEGHSHEDIKRGERFFLGLLPFERKSASCVSCHNLTPTDTLNWNPSAMGIAVKYAGKDFAAFQSAVMQPSGKLMEEVHKNFEIQEEDLKLVKLYLDELAIAGPAAQKPTINNLLIFLFVGLLITWALLELIFFRKIKYRMIPVVILLAGLGLQLKMVVEEGIKLGRSQGYMPDQPIKFSHKVHAGDNGIDCKYCHSTVEYGKSAGIPAMELCMNCHVVVREGTHSGKFEIAKVVEANEKKIPVEWVRIHNLPDHVFFSHAQHVGVAGLDCAKCHGDVASMDVVKQVSDLSMGWCINCHRETNVKFSENHYYDNYIQLHEDLKAGKIDSVKAVQIGANDCMRCHY